ncbi:hypothetical protein BD289DRAFT_30117 [Coniella lustricola]|uniref:Uncharacterized protein n=1 Tax=Coniella lustricola TaxID=2025994 RepID=A0A2T3AJ80_9PEZI|nr:hypothetical protein BD289DRAFT_30117 [Coniella lustricola]
MTEKITFPTESSSSSSSSSALRPLQAPISPPAHSPVSLHAMSTRSSDALPRRQSTIQHPAHHRQQQQHFLQQQQQHHHHHQHPTSPESPRALPTRLALESPPRDPPPNEGRLTRKRARSINIDEANRSRIAELSLQSPGLGPSPPHSASAVSASDSICICPTPPKVPRPRNGMLSLVS